MWKSVRVYFIPLLVCFMIIATLLAGCSEATKEAGTTTPAKQVPKEILIGDTVSYTGPYAVFGGISSFGTEAAVEDINKQGGIYVKEYDAKIPVRWITRDCESDPNKVAPLTEDLILNDKVNFLGGHFEVPTLRQGTAMVAEKYGIPAVFGVGTYEAWIGMRDAAATPWNHSWAFGFSIGTPAQAGDFRADQPGYLMMPTWFGALAAFSEKTNKKAAVFAFDDPDGRGWYEGFTGAVASQGYECYRAADGFGIYPPGTNDFSSLIQEWKNAGCEILWGNCPAPDMGTVLKQCKTQGFEPKVVFATRGAMFFQEISSWGGDLANGVGMEVYWTPEMTNSVGIGGETPQTLAARWFAQSNDPVPQGIGWNYAVAMTLFDAIERAGTLDHEAVNKALAETDLNTMWGRVVFEKNNQFQRVPCQFGQWQKTDKGYVAPTVFSYNDFMPATAELIFPKPWD